MTAYKVARDSNPDMNEMGTHTSFIENSIEAGNLLRGNENEMGRCWEDYDQDGTGWHDSPHDTHRRARV